ncbi:MAG: bifunctional chorismate mutase/prephenate dehydrogenase [Balneolaceae bacterium]
MSEPEEKPLSEQRQKIDTIDEKILDLLKERNEVSRDVVRRKVRSRLPIFVAKREEEKTAVFRKKAVERGLDPDWSEDFLRMIMSSSRASQSSDTFPRSTTGEKHILYVGGEGGMGRLYRKITKRTGHHVYSIDKGNWHELEELCPKLDLVVVTVPIHVTEEVIRRLSRNIGPDTILADFTSNKAEPLRVMLEAHSGPVLGLHPMHGPDVENLSKQLMVVCPGRKPEASEWFVKQCELWGMRVVRADPEKHDHVMHLVQGLRHYVALLHGSFMREFDLKPQEMLDYSSPIYRAELMMTGRIFAQDAELYADIVFSNRERRELLMQFFEHHQKLAGLVKSDDKRGFIREFEAVTDFFGKFAAQALDESGYLINRLADRFS